MRAPIQSNKHYVQISLATILGGANLNTQIADAVTAPAADPQKVRIGAIVKAVFIEIWIRTSETTPGTVLATFYKGKQDQTLGFAEQVSLHTYSGKADIYYHTQGLTNDTDADAIPFMRGWFKVPKSKQRMALGDSLNLSVASQAAIDNVICGFMTYKEYF